MKAEELLVPVLLLKLLSNFIEIDINSNFLSAVLTIREVLFKRPVAQLAERRSPKPKVGGSMPSWPAI